MNTLQVVQNVLAQCETLKRKNKRYYNLRGIKFSKTNINNLEKWLSEGCQFDLNQREKWLLAILMN